MTHLTTHSVASEERCDVVDTAVALTALTAGTVSTKIDTSGTSVATGNTAVIAAVGNTRQLIIGLYGTGAATATVLAGDEPPSEDSGLGNGDAQTIDVGKGYILVLPAGRYVQDNGTVRILIGSTGPVIVTAWSVPRTV